MFLGKNNTFYTKIIKKNKPKTITLFGKLHKDNYTCLFLALVAKAE
jgi:hypothetical protein